MKRILSALIVFTITQISTAISQVTFPYVIQEYGSIGMCVYGEVDINQDGFRDLIATTIDAGPFTGAKLFVYSGKDFSTLYTFSHRISGDNYSITSIDANHDGFPDIVVPGMTFGNDDNDTGFLKVYSGKDGLELYQANLGKLRISCVNSISDLNSDGTRDILVGSGRNCVVLSGKDGTVIYDLHVQSYYGVILPLEDINGDSVPDIAVSSDRIGTGGENGTISLFSGSNGSLITTIIGTGIGFGHTMSTCPDQDGDNLEDLVISVTTTDSAFLYSTRTGEQIGIISKPFGGPGVFGIFSKNLGDIDGDGLEDIVISDNLGSGEGDDYTWSGTAFVFSGSDFQLLNSFYGVQYSFFGLSVTSLGDLNNDGRQEIAIGAPGASRIYIFSTYVTGDANQDGKITLGDVIVKVNFLFRSGPRPFPMSVADDDCNGTLDINDILCTVNYIFRGHTQGCCQK